MNTKDIAKQFRRPFFSTWDRTFFSIFIIAITLEALIVSFLATQPVERYSQRDIRKIQERFAKFVLQTEPVKNESALDASSGTEGAKDSPAKKEKGGEAKPKKNKQGSAEKSVSGSSPGSPGRASSASAVEARKKEREAVSKSVSSMGILGLITASEGSSSKDTVNSIFENSGVGKSNGNLDEILSSVSGLKTSGKSDNAGSGSGRGAGGTIRGGRKGKSATINDLVSDLGSASSSVMQRKGGLVVETPDQVLGTGRKSIYRSATAIQEVLLSHNSAIRYCYERELKRYPTLKGKISVRITVSPEGHVTKAEIVSSTLNNRRVERCILSRIRLWQDFKPIKEQEGDVTFRQVWSFGY